MTVEEFMNIDDDDRYRHELIKGELLTMPSPKPLHGRVVANLVILLGLHVKANRLGDVHAESGYHLEHDPDTVLGPDVSFVSAERVDRSDEHYYDGPPDLAVKVLSPGDKKGYVERKLAIWLETEDDELVDDTIPGFRVKVSEIFA